MSRSPSFHWPASRCDVRLLIYMLPYYIQRQKCNETAAAVVQLITNPDRDRAKSRSRKDATQGGMRTEIKHGAKKHDRDGREREFVGVAQNYTHDNK